MNVQWKQTSYIHYKTIQLCSEQNQLLLSHLVVFTCTWSDSNQFGHVIFCFHAQRHTGVRERWCSNLEDLQVRPLHVNGVRVQRSTSTVEVLSSTDISGFYSVTLQSFNNLTIQLQLLMVKIECSLIFFLTSSTFSFYLPYLNLKIPFFLPQNFQLLCVFCQFMFKQVRGHEMCHLL